MYPPQLNAPTISWQVFGLPFTVPRLQPGSDYSVRVTIDLLGNASCAVASTNASTKGGPDIEERVRPPQPTAVPIPKQPKRSRQSNGFHGKPAASSTSDVVLWLPHTIPVPGQPNGEMGPGQGGRVDCPADTRRPERITVDPQPYGMNIRCVTDAEVGRQDMIDSGIINAVDIWGLVPAAVQVCFQDSGRVMFLDASTSPRTLSQPDIFLVEGFICVRIPGAGMLVLLAHTEASSPPPVEQTVARTACTVIITTATVYLRNGPGTEHHANGALVKGSTWNVRKLVDGYYEIVLVEGSRGWISAMYTEPVGTC